MKKNVKKVCIILMFFILILSFSINIVYITYTWDFEQFDTYTYEDTDDKIQNAGATIITMFQVVALGVAVIMLVVYGIRYVLTATTDKKVEMKKNLPNYIIGVVFAFSASVLLQIVKDFIDKNVNQ